MDEQSICTWFHPIVDKNTFQQLRQEQHTAWYQNEFEAFCILFFLGQIIIAAWSAALLCWAAVEKRLPGNIIAILAQPLRLLGVSEYSE